ncbi:hypothetical protein [Candidatus Accumulibacter aalborgensis]|uniref:hypothetical protein n=1 Tax=Candidatus Accumulibacter aalborgensis TaxID=1860102 RepID=UPI000AC52ED9|nr:hypothetical protein [Candidatus Accumulibacter aalborgensis]
MAASLAVLTDPQVGDCVVFREGGVGLLLLTPVYWLKGSVAGVSRQQRVIRACPRIGKQASAYTPADHARLAGAMPCVDEGGVTADGAELRDVIRVQVAVADWETPWSHQQGTTGWLFRGQFLNQTLKKGGVIDMDVTWLVPCEAGR